MKLEGLNEQRVDKVNRLKKAEKDRDELSSSKEGAEAYIAREQKIRIRQNVLYQVHESTALDNVRQFTTRKDEAKAQLEHERSKMKDGEKELSALETAYVAKKAEYDAVCEERNGVMSVSLCTVTLICTIQSALSIQIFRNHFRKGPPC